MEKKGKGPRVCTSCVCAGRTPPHPDTPAKCDAGDSLHEKPKHPMMPGVAVSCGRVVWLSRVVVSCGYVVCLCVTMYLRE